MFNVFPSMSQAQFESFLNVNAHAKEAVWCTFRVTLSTFLLKLFMNCKNSC